MQVIPTMPKITLSPLKSREFLLTKGLCDVLVEEPTSHGRVIWTSVAMKSAVFIVVLVIFGINFISVSGKLMANWDIAVCLCGDISVYISRLYGYIRSRLPFNWSLSNCALHSQMNTVNHAKFLAQQSHILGISFHKLFKSFTVRQ